MPTPSSITIGDNPTLKEVVDYVIKLERDYTWLLQNLDDLNVTRLTAEVIKTGTLDANVVTIRSDLSGGAYVQIDGNGMVINNGSTNTFEADIDGNVAMTSATIRNDLSSAGYVQIDNDGIVINNGLYNTFTANSAGQVTMTNALIQSSPSGYPRVEIDPTANRIAAWESADNGVYLTPGDGSNPAGLIFQKARWMCRPACTVP